MLTIRTITALGFAGLAIAATLVSQVDANGDLDTLLNELSFNKPQVVGNLEAAPDDVASPLSGQADTLTDDSKLDPSPILEQDGFSYIEPSQLPQPPDQRDSRAQSDAASQQLTGGPHAAIPNRMPPASGYAPQNNGYANNAGRYSGAVANGPFSPIYQPAVGQYGGCGCRSGCDSAGCNHYAAPPQKEELYIAHRTPNLPSSTLREYFNSSACHTGLWDGYAQERAQQCATYHKHIHGTCDCAQKTLENYQNGGFFCKGAQGAGCCDSGCDSCRY
ncbi:hypothetical protein Q31b_32400 [Novipirellula aureliae]|uniref:Uncharacterized protein n=1 Tax=Novipirellula aureliae TaxID=2527966 RepID=A0A5C6DUJ1_9BACT|nr:hypothetical protein [Novipirellula aureliae]TWU39924.1 hypothetical protein Q31b_32400 [Novipirellula aureliae]